MSPFSDDGWRVVITFEEDGYVEGDDASSIDFDEQLADVQSDVREERAFSTTTSACSAGATCFVLNGVAYMDQLALVKKDLEPLLADIEFNEGTGRRTT